MKKLIIILGVVLGLGITAFSVSDTDVLKKGAEVILKYNAPGSTVEMIDDMMLIETPVSSVAHYFNVPEELIDIAIKDHYACQVVTGYLNKQARITGVKLPGIKQIRLVVRDKENNPWPIGTVNL